MLPLAAKGVQMGIADAIKKLPFLNPKVEAIGLEIGTSTIKIVECRPGAPPSLKALSVVPTPIGSMQGGVVVEPKLIADEIRNGLSEAKIRNRYVVSAIASQQAITRNISIPKMPEKELDEAIKWEAERYIPFPIEEVVLDYYLLDNPDDIEEGGQMEVVIAAAQNEVVAKDVEVLRLAGLEPVAIDLKSFATLRALHGSILGEHLNKSTLSGRRYTEANEVAVVMEVGANVATITLVKGERVLMNRNISIAADDFSAAIQKAFGIPFDQAEEIKLDYGSATLPTEDEEDLLDFNATRDRFSPAQVYDSLRPVLVELTTEIRRSLDFFRVQSGEAVIDRMILTGGGSKLRGLPEAIGDALGFKVEMGDPWLSCTYDDKVFDSAYLKEVAPELSVALGLALRGVTELD